jgi:diguanylate cyclase (GGDEF)-like protein/PAS domain S-box-containing protein
MEHAVAGPEAGAAADPVEAALLALLAADPGALVGTVGGEDSPRLVPVPASVPVADHPQMGVESMLDLVEPADRVVVAKLWGQARTQGVAVGPVRRIGHDGPPTRLYLFDLRFGHGVMVAVLTGQADVNDAMVEAARLPALPPRFARATKDAGAVLRSVDPALTQLLGWPPEALLGHRTLEFIHADDQELAIANWMELLEHPGPGRRVRLRHRHADGSWMWLEITNHNRLEDPEHGDVLAEMVDISDEMAAHEALRAREQLLAQLTETVPVGLFHADLRGNLLFANRRFYDITHSAPESPLEATLANLPDTDRAALIEAVRSARGGAEVDLEVAVAPPGAPVRHCVVSVRPLFDDAGAVTGLTGCLEDITDGVRARHELEIRAASDPLTGCLNRTAILAVLQELLDRGPVAGRAGHGGTAVVFVDLDRFKPVNDRLGHAAGDELLVQVAGRIGSAVRSSDVVGRLGGDEFVVVCPGVSGPSDAQRIARALAARLCGTVTLEAGPVELRASFGVAWSDTQGLEATRLLDAADAAMYCSKRDGRCQPVMGPPLPD